MFLGNFGYQYARASAATPCINTHERCSTREDQAHRHNGSAHRRDDSSNATRAASSGGTTDESAPASVAATLSALCRSADSEKWCCCLDDVSDNAAERQC